MKYKKRLISDILRFGKTVFTLKDISLLWRDTDKKATISAINYYIKRGELYRIRRGIYSKDKNYDRLELATRIFTPSYVSFETILIQAGINFQFYEKITIASYQTREIVIDGQRYSYKKIKDDVLTNSIGIENKNEISLSTPERAFLDTLYLYKNYHFDNISSLDWEKIFEILPIYNNKTMVKKVKMFFEYYKFTK